MPAKSYPVFFSFARFLAKVKYQGGFNIKKITIRCEIELVDWIETYSKKYRINKNDIYNELLKLGISKMYESESVIFNMEGEKYE